MSVPPEKKSSSGVEAQLLRLLDDERPGPDLVAVLAGDRSPSEGEQKLLRRLKRRRGRDFYSDVIFAVTHCYVPHETARAVWRQVLRHRRQLRRELDRDLGLTVAALDYLTNIAGIMSQPTVIPAGKLTAMAEIALKDGLTGLFDHAAFQTKLRDEARRFERYGDAFSVLILDLDDFKQINDTWGHPRGDEVLRQVAAIIEDTSRDTDVAARYGGEEFAVLAVRTPLPRALELAERIRCRVERDLADPYELTASVGVAACPNHADSPRALVRAADKALYRAKRAGKNRVVQP